MGGACRTQQKVNEKGTVDLAQIKKHLSGKDLVADIDQEWEKLINTYSQDTKVNDIELDFKNSRIGAKSIQALGSFKQKSRIKEINFTNCDLISDQNWESFFTAWTEQTSNLHQLILSGTQIGNKGLAKIPQVILKFLRKLEFMNCQDITDEAWNAFFKRYPAASKLQELNISHISIGKSGINALIESAALKSLKNLEINNAKAIPDEEWCVFFTKFPIENTFIQTLDLGGNEINQSMKELNKSHILKSVQQIYFFHLKNAYDDNWEDLFTSWPKECQLKELDLSDSSISNKGIAALSQSAIISTLKDLNVNMCSDIKDQGWEKFFANVPENNHIEVFTCESNQIGNLAIAALSKSHILQSLEKLNFQSAMTPSDAEWEKLFVAWPQKSKLKSLTLSCTSVGEKALMAIEKSTAGASVEILELDSCSEIPEKTWVEFLKNWKSTKIEKLKLGFTLINGDALQAMTESPVIQQVVKKLDLSSLQADDTEWETFFKQMPADKKYKLEELSVSKSKLGEKAVNAFLASSITKGIKKLVLSNCTLLTDKLFETLFSQYPEGAQLKDLELVQTQIGKCGLNALALSRVCVQLEELKLNECSGIQYDEWKDFFETFPDANDQINAIYVQNTSVNQISLSGCSEKLKQKINF